MKTLVVLSVLVGLAVSAPAPEEVLQSLIISEDTKPLDINAEINFPILTARSNAGFKNPVIVKKKTGYHLYRDSTEERADADPRENCGKQVRVKLCDDNAKSADLRRSTKDENFAMHKDEVKDSIKLAKEAVESVQRDLKTIEHDSSGKRPQWKHGESDKNLHEDIEAVRQALEHAQKNFGNLESMNMRAATISNADFSHDHASADKERLAQWKLAMENIQRNVEIARSIEDSFKAAEHAEAIDTTKLMRSSTNDNKAVFHKNIKETSSGTSGTSGRSAFEENSSKKIIGTKSEQHTTTQKKAEEHEREMETAASDSILMKHKHQHHHMHHNPKAAHGSDLAHVSLNVKDLLQTDANVEHGKDKVHLDASVRSAHSEDKMLAHNKASKTMHSESAHKATLNTDMSARTSENAHHQLAARKEESMKNTFESHNLHGNEHKTMHQAKTVSKDWESNIADKNSKHEKSVWTETEHKDMIMKSSEHNQAEHLTENKNHKSDAEMFVKKTGLSVHSDMKFADNTEQASDIHLNQPINAQSHHDSLKSADLPKGLDMKQARVTFGHKKHGHHDHGHHEYGHHGQQHGHYEHGHGHGHGHYGHYGHHGKSADFDSAMHPSMQVEMKEFEKSALENMAQWKHHHDAARSSYGSGYGGGLSLAAPGGAGAVGVFPQAKIGGCSVPLLLSCSPSVVSGSLAKSQGYAAPAYRTGEESSFKNKRDIINTKESSFKKVKDDTKSIKSNDLVKKL